MDWGNLFTSFQGRVSRQPFWLGLLGLLIIQWIVGLVLGAVLGISMMGNIDPNMTPEQAMSQSMSGLVPLLIISLIFLYPTLAVYTKRWHDRNKSGWWSLILFVPIIGFFWWLIECGFLRGTEGMNDYGPDPIA
jgi:uncharacterized membrane protein YhaH (DUF805 family)